MQSFPLFLKLSDRRVLVVGGGERAARKAGLLLSAGARVALIAPTVTGGIAQAIAERHIAWAGHSFHADDIDGVSLVIVACEDETLQARVSHIAQERGVPVNVVDNPVLSSFIMPAIVDRGPVTVAISTGGAAPALARRLRAEIERAVPSAIGRLARFADIFRAQVKRTLIEPHARRRFWDRVFEGRVGELALAGDEISARRELIRLLDGARHQAPAKGIVHVLRGGPDDPDLLTLKAHRLLQSADVVVHGMGASPAVLAMARRDAARIAFDDRDQRIDRFEEQLTALALEGNRVVWLASSDDRGHGNEMIAALIAAGIIVERVPGVTETRDVEAHAESPAPVHRG